MINILEKVSAIAKEAGNYMKQSKQLKVYTKTDVANIVTNIDVEVQKQIIQKLQTVIANASFIAEEKDNEMLGNGYVWVIDPIDGTTNFAYDFKHSCISIGLLKDKQAVLGVVYNPYLDELFTATKGNGSYLNGAKIAVNQNDLKESLVVMGTSPYRKELATTTFAIMKDIFLSARDIRRTGSAALDICYVACGRVDAYFEANVSPWDYCAASIILEEARGVCRSLTTATFSFEEPIAMLAANANNFDGLYQIIVKYEI